MVLLISLMRLSLLAISAALGWQWWGRMQWAIALGSAWAGLGLLYWLRLQNQNRQHLRSLFGDEYNDRDSAGYRAGVGTYLVLRDLAIGIALSCSCFA